jgi:hypothetical protein
LLKAVKLHGYAICNVTHKLSLFRDIDVKLSNNLVFDIVRGRQVRNPIPIPRGRYACWRVNSFDDPSALIAGIEVVRLCTGFVPSAAAAPLGRSLGASVTSTNGT